LKILAFKRRKFYILLRNARLINEGRSVLYVRQTAPGAFDSVHGIGADLPYVGPVDTPEGLPGPKA
jgi:hypothetical protein